MRPGSLIKVRAPEGSTSQCQPGGCQSRASPSGLIKRGIGKAGAEEKQRVEERRRRVEEGDGFGGKGRRSLCAVRCRDFAIYRQLEGVPVDECRSNSSQALKRNPPLIQLLASACTKHSIRVIL